MSELSFILIVFTAVTSLISAVASLVAACIKHKMDALNRKLESVNEENVRNKKELFDLYCNVNELLQIEKDLSDQLEIGKITARRGYQTTSVIQPKKVVTRIIELQKELNLN